MAQIDTIVNVNISLSATSVTTVSFAIPLIIGPTNAGWSDYVHSYTSPAGMLTDGFTDEAPEYIYALELYEQALSPAQFFVGHRTTAVEQVDTFTVGSLTGVPGHVYKFTFNSSVISYTSQEGDSYANIIDGLSTAFSAAVANTVAAGVVSGSGSGTTLTITSAVAGLGFSISAVDSELTHTAVTPNNGIQNDLTNIQGENNSWYGVCLAGGNGVNDADVFQLASVIESQTKLYVPISNASGIPTSSSSDTASQLQALGYKRTALIYSPENSEGKEAAWLGGQLPTTPGSSNWAWKSLVGCTPDLFSDTAMANMIGNPAGAVAGKNVNVYTTLYGANVTMLGLTASGQPIDVTIGIDWMKATVQTNVYNLLVNTAKIPYTDLGTAMVEQCVDQMIKTGVANGLIDGTSPISISAPSVLSVPATQRQNRIAPTITFSCRLAGAYNSFVINGTVSV